MGQEQSQPISQQMYVQQEEEQVKRQQHLYIQPSEEFQSSFNPNQQRLLNEQRNAQISDPTQDYEGRVLLEQQNPFLQQQNTEQTFVTPASIQAQQPVQHEVEQNKIQEQLAAVPQNLNQNNNYTASFGQLEQMMLHQQQNKYPKDQSLSPNIPTSSDTRHQSPNLLPAVASIHHNDENEQTKYWDSARGQPYEPNKAKLIEKLLRSTSGYEIQAKQSPKNANSIVSRLLEKGKQIEARNGITSDYYDQREIQQCTFQPNQQSEFMNKSVSPHRSLQQFLAEQNKFVSNRDLNIRRIQANLAEQEKDTYTHKPQILQNSNAIMISNSQKQTDEPAFKRLFGIQKRKKEFQEKNDKDKQQEERDQKKIKQANPQTIDRLYNLGKIKVSAKREGKIDLVIKTNEEDSKKEEDKSSNKQSGTPRNDSTKQSEFCLATKLIKEYEQIVSIIVEDIKQQSYLLNYIQMSEVLKLMGLISCSENIESHNFVKERTLVNDVWVLLHGQQHYGVSYRNLLLFIFALMGIDIDLPKFKAGQINTQVEFSKDQANPLLRDFAEVQSSLLSEQMKAISHSQIITQLENQNENFNHNKLGQSQQQQKQILLSQQQSSQQYQFFHQSPPFGSPKGNQINYNDATPELKQWMQLRERELKIGVFDQQKNLILSSNDVKQIQTIFYLFYVNRLHTQKEKQSYIGNGNNTNQVNNNVSSINGNQSSNNKLNKSLSTKVIQEVPQYKTDQLASNYRNRVWESTITSNDKLQQLGDKVQHVDILIAQRADKQKYLQQLKLNQDDNIMNGCTFHPKTNNYVQVSHSVIQQPNNNNISSDNNNKNNISANITNQQFSTAQERPNNNPMPPISIGNKRYVDLYNLAKPRSQLRDKKTFEVEYEKNCDECTFNPDLAATNNHNHSKIRSPKNVEVKNKQFAIERMRKAWENQMLHNRKLARGYYEFKDNNQKVNITSPTAAAQSERKRIYSLKQESALPRTSKSQLRKPGQNPKLDTGLQQLQQGQQNYGELVQIQAPTPYNHWEQNQQDYQQQQIYQQQPSLEQNDLQQQLQQQQQQQSQQEQQQMQQLQQQLQPEQIQQNEESLSLDPQKRQNPLLFVDINLSEEVQERIVIYEGDQPEELARQFIQKHGLDNGLQDKLTQMLIEQLNSSVNQLKQQASS